MNAPIKYFGGKNGMYKNILPYFPSPESYETYIEPFGGSYAIGLHMSHVPKAEIYNDIYENVYSLYKVLADESLYSDFKRLADIYPYSEQYREEFRESLRSDELTDVDRAFRFFYVNRTSHNGIGGLSVNTVSRRGMAKSTSDYLSAVDGLEAYHQRLSRVVIMHRDGVEVMKRFGVKDDVFMYCDPPYEWSTRGTTRYAVDMDEAGQRRFVDACLSCRSKLLISGYDNELYERLVEGGFEKINFDVTMTTNEVKKRTETLWRNYN